MAQYMNCDNCLIRYEKEKHMFIANCSHILCINCQPKQDRCLVCKKVCKTKAINRDAGPLITNLFKEVSSDEIIKSTKFQIDKLAYQIQRRDGLITKYEEQKKASMKINDSTRVIKLAINEERNLIMKLKERKTKSSPSLLQASPKLPESVYIDECRSPSSSMPKQHSSYSLLHGLSSTSSLTMRQQTISSFRSSSSESHQPSTTASSRLQTSLSPLSSERSPFAVRPSAGTTKPLDPTGGQKKRQRSPCDDPEFVRSTKQDVYEQYMRKLASSKEKGQPINIKVNQRSEIDRARNILF